MAKQKIYINDLKIGRDSNLAFTRKDFWIHAYLALIQNNSTTDAAVLANQALLIAVKRWENTVIDKAAYFVKTSDLPMYQKTSHQDHL